MGLKHLIVILLKEMWEQKRRRMCIANAIADAKAEQMHANLAKVEHHGYAPHEIVR